MQIRYLKTVSLSLFLTKLCLLKFRISLAFCLKIQIKIYKIFTCNTKNPVFTKII